MTGKRRATKAKTALQDATDLAARLGKALKDARLKAQLTQGQAATRAGMSQAAWSLLERSRAPGFTLLTWDRAAHAVGASLDAFIKGASAADQPRDLVQLRAQETVIVTAAPGGWAGLPRSSSTETPDPPRPPTSSSTASRHRHDDRSMP